MKEWTRTPTDWGDDPVVHVLADVLRVTAAQVIGHLLCLWSVLPAHARDGVLAEPRVTPTLLEQWARWRGKRGAFAEAFKAHVLDAQGAWPLWEELNGAVLREKDTDKTRAAERRRQIKHGKEQQLDAFAATTAAALVKSPADGPPDGPALRTNGRYVPTAGTAGAHARNGQGTAGGYPRASADIVPIRPHAPAVAVAPPWCPVCGDGVLTQVDGQRRGVRVHLEQCPRGPSSDTALAASPRPAFLSHPQGALA